MNRLLSSCWLLAIAMTNTMAWGHPGHGVTAGDSPVHYVVEPEHSMGWLLPGLIVLCVALVAWPGGRMARQLARVARPQDRSTASHR